MNPSISATNLKHNISFSMGKKYRIVKENTFGDQRNNQ